MNTKIEGAFQGIKVLELTRGKSGAFCGMMLADNGAEVIKVNELGWDSAQVDPYY
jgi:crotonobetainyl-CoA:carnitine CoA-transferase CaiB-like acyl-CoA transferase